jgi:hypothetical protein
MTPKNKKPQRGGAREGAGRKPTLTDPVKPQAYIDRSTKGFYTDLGSGNFSLGLRRAAEIIRRLKTSYPGGDLFMIENFVEEEVK